MKVTIRLLLGSVALLTLGACADVVEGSRANINVTTAPSMNVTCTLTNSQGSVGVFTPNNALVPKSKTDITTTCVDATTGARGQTTTSSDIEPWVFGNILWGLASPITLGVDLATGAANKYPQAIVVPMTMPASAYMAPAAINGQMAVPAMGTPPAPAPFAPAVPTQLPAAANLTPVYSH